MVVKDTSIRTAGLGNNGSIRLPVAQIARDTFDQSLELAMLTSVARSSPRECTKAHDSRCFFGSEPIACLAPDQVAMEALRLAKRVSLVLRNQGAVFIKALRLEFKVNQNYFLVRLWGFHLASVHILKMFLKIIDQSNIFRPHLYLFLFDGSRIPYVGHE